MESKQTQKYIPFAVRYSLKQRKQKFEKQRVEKPNFIPLIIQRHPKSHLPDIDKSRFVCEKNNKFIMVQKMIESKIEKLLQGKTTKEIKRKDGKATFFLYVGNNVPNGDQEMVEIYDKYKAEDGFLYIKYAEMDTF